MFTRIKFKFTNLTLNLKLARVFVLACILLSCRSVTPEPTQTPIPTPTPTPPNQENVSLQLGFWHDMVYHESLETIILVNGGPEQGKPDTAPIELWSWDGNQWSPLLKDPNGPTWRNFASIAYDSNRDVLILYGGLTSNTEYTDTWEWDGNEWTQFPVEGPGMREGAGMAFDALRNRVVLFGGGQSGKMMDDIWEWDGSQWTQISASGPTARFPAGFVYDAVNQNILLFGGHAIEGNKFSTFSDTWVWNGLNWEEVNVSGPSARDGARAIFDPISERVFLFGGAEFTNTATYLNDTWIWDGAQWENLPVSAPPARVHLILAYDPKRSVIVMTGGSNGPGMILDDTWEWDGEVWACKSECQ